MHKKSAKIAYAILFIFLLSVSKPFCFLKGHSNKIFSFIFVLLASSNFTSICAIFLLLTMARTRSQCFRIYYVVELQLQLCGVDFCLKDDQNRIGLMELDLQNLYGLHVHSCTHWLKPRNHPPSIPLHLGSYTRALLVRQDRRHLFVNPWNQCSPYY
jgi:hypothetical protein